MFGRKKETEEIPSVPVYTVHSLPRKYEPIDTVCVQLSDVWSKNLRDNHVKVMNELGKEAAKLGADAVLGFMLHSQGTSAILNAYGTAIKYND
ncbi:heavy metal-binding domain-containing protein [Paenibacillus filicis]|uniref:Heavy metal-binding domain-containing protein n=1 Tax=Paenibacillus gyeongsangnamensis TaxID=3388067 RepID=A0ABT4Q6A3_9BACL|nr:heavy metal-binding domain-containing protein [Paenibacillus filicis]MCZ8512400.1 heavy metal-binding domain-containing protein [Paenibacillus filicis]